MSKAASILSGLGQVGIAFSKFIPGRAGEIASAAGAALDLAGKLVGDAPKKATRFKSSHELLLAAISRPQASSADAEAMYEAVVRALADGAPT